MWTDLNKVAMKGCLWENDIGMKKMVTKESRQLWSHCWGEDWVKDWVKEIMFCDSQG